MRDFWLVILIFLKSGFEILISILCCLDLHANFRKKHFLSNSVGFYFLRPVERRMLGGGKGYNLKEKKTCLESTENSSSHKTIHLQQQKKEPLKNLE